MVDSSAGHWPPFSLLKMFLCCCKGKIYDPCVRSCVLHGSETWSLKRENELALHRVEMKMISWICGVKLKI